MASAKRRIAGRGRARLARRSSRGPVLEPAPDPSRRPVGRGRKVGLTEDLAAVTGERGARACSKLAHDRTACMATGRHQLTRNDTWSAISCRPSNLRIDPPRLGHTLELVPARMNAWNRASSTPRLVPASARRATTSQSCMEIPTPNGSGSPCSMIDTAARAVARGSSWTDRSCQPISGRPYGTVSCVPSPFPAHSSSCFHQN